MMRLKHLALGVAVTAGLGVACSKEPSAPPVTQPSLTSASPGVTPTPTFKFAPPDGTRFIRTDTRTQEASIPGTPLRRSDQQELQWKVGIDRKGDQYQVTQDLVHASFKRDGQVFAEGDVPSGTISAQLVIDRDGNLVSVAGLEQTAATLRGLAAPGKEEEAARILTPQYLADLVAQRYRVLYGETIGRQATPGASWTVNNPSGSFVASRKVTVDRMEPCGPATCARLRVDFKLDPRVLADTAMDLVRTRVAQYGGDPSKISIRSASYGMNGVMLVEPQTMLNHGATLAEGGSITVAGPNQDFDVELKGTTELAYSYLGVPVASKQ